MKETLKKLYKSAYHESVTEFDFDKNYYFLDDKQKIFSLSKEEVSKNELALILSQYDLLSEEFGYEKHQQLMDFLFGKDCEIQNYKHLKYYFIKFMNIKDEDTYRELNQLLYELFHDNTYFVKKLNVYLLIVDHDDDIQFLEVLKSIESDFLIQMVGFMSDLYEVNTFLPDIFQFDFNTFISYQKTDQLLIHKKDLLQCRILHHMDESIKKQIKAYILKDYIHDTEMLNVIKMYFKTNFNSTLAAKNCYMHRNTFINKLDKFIESTHFNLRQYEEAFIVYLALVL